MTSNHLHEFSEIDLSIAVLVGLAHHVFDVVLRGILAEVLHHTPKVVDAREDEHSHGERRARGDLLDVTTVGTIEHSKGFLQFFDGIGEIHFHGEQRQELIEGDLTGD